MSTQAFFEAKREEKPRASLMHTDTPPSPGVIRNAAKPKE